jgi:hypothetical protein
VFKQGPCVRCGEPYQQGAGVEKIIGVEAVYREEAENEVLWD